MSALIIAHVKPKNPEKLLAYAEAAGRTLERFGGRILHRGTYATALLGAAEPHGLGVMQFPDTDAARQWFASDAYQAIAPLRDEAAEMTFVIYDVAD